MIGGTIGTPRNTSPPADIIVDAIRPPTRPVRRPTDPWIRHLHEPGWSTLAVLSRNQLLMYQDVVDPALRSHPPASTVEETRPRRSRHDVLVHVRVRGLLRIRAALFDMVQMMDGNAGADDATVMVTISFDDQWMVRYLDVNIDFDAVLKYKAERDAGIPYPYRYTVDVVSIIEKPQQIPAPTNTIDPPDRRNIDNGGDAVMAKKKKKGHGGLKFMAFIVVVVVLIVAISKGSKTETGQRILGNRQDRRLENTKLTPRFGFAAAKLRDNRRIDVQLRRIDHRHHFDEKRIH